MSAASLTIVAGREVPVVTGIGNAASFAPGIAAGALQEIQGVNLSGGQTAITDYQETVAGVQVLLNGSPVPLTYVSDTQINLYVPQDAALGSGTLTVVTPSGVRATAAVTVAAVQPGTNSGYRSMSLMSAYIRAGDSAINADRFTSRISPI